MIDQFLHLISFDIAESLGLKHYFTGDTCKRGGVGLRRVNQKKCICTFCLADNKSRCAARHAACREVSLQQMRDYYAKNQAATIARAAEYRKENRERINAEARAARKADPEKAREKDRRSASKNKEAKRESSRKWQKENLDIMRKHNSRRRAAKKERLPSWYGELDEFVMREAASLCKARKRATGFDWHVDHIIPLRGELVSGLHCASNLQVIPASLNLAKGNRLIAAEVDAWLAHI